MRIKSPNTSKLDCSRACIKELQHAPLTTGQFVVQAFQSPCSVQVLGSLFGSGLSCPTETQHSFSYGLLILQQFDQFVDVGMCTSSFGVFLFFLFFFFLLG